MLEIVLALYNKAAGIHGQKITYSVFTDYFTQHQLPGRVTRQKMSQVVPSSFLFLSYSLMSLLLPRSQGCLILPLTVPGSPFHSISLQNLVCPGPTVHPTSTLLSLAFILLLSFLHSQTQLKVDEMLSHFSLQGNSFPSFGTQIPVGLFPQNGEDIMVKALLYYILDAWAWE